MSSFLKNVFGKAASSSSAVKIAETPAAISYTLASFRWHTDTRAPVKAIALHDYLGSCTMWQQFLHVPVADLPLSRLTPTTPLEVYCADLRGHNFSETAPVTSRAAYPLACAADVVKMQAEVLRAEAPLFGFGFGSLVASCAALHAPDAFSSLTLIVKDIGEILECKPSESKIAGVIRNAPRDLSTLAQMNDYLRQTVTDAAERAVLLSAVEVRDGKCRFRYHAELLQGDEPLQLQAPADVKYAKPTNIYVFQEGRRAAPEQEAAVRARFPAATITRFDVKESQCTLSALPAAHMALQACKLLGEIRDEEVS